MESTRTISPNIRRTGTIISPGFSAFGDNTPANSPGPYSQRMKEKGGQLTVVDRKTKDEINKINRATHGPTTVVKLMKDLQREDPRRSTRITRRTRRVNPYGGKKSRKNRRKTKKRRKSKRRRRKGKKSVKSR